MVDAMRSVAEHARDGSLADVRRSVEQAVGTLRAAGGQHAAELRRRAEDDIAAIEDSARAEAERIRREAEARIAARRDQLEHDLAVEASRTERDIDAIQARVTDYERELSHFFAGLREVRDPAAFAAAVRRMPTPPGLAPGEVGVAEAAPPAAAGASAVVDAPREDAGSLDPVETAAPAAAQASGVAVEPREETADGEGQRDEPAAEAPIDDFTQVIVQGLGSFGAITAFKQSLERSEGIGSVALSLGPTGEFVYRATHSSRFDIEAAISELEGGTAELRRDPDGTLRVIVARG